MSGFDVNGLPQISKLDFVIMARNYRLSDEQLQELIDRVLLIHDLNLSRAIEKLNRNV